MNSILITVISPLTLSSLEVNTSVNAPAMVPLGLKGVTVPNGSHIAHLSTEAAEALDIATTFIVEGIQRDETVGMVVPRNRTDSLMNTLNQMILLERLNDTGKLQLNQGMDTPERHTEYLFELASKSKGRLRVFGDMTWTQTKGWQPEHLTRLEKSIQQLQQPGGCLFLCQYALESFSGREIMMAMETHTHNIYRGQVRENPYG